ncbi:MAG TPA: O-antigen ligase family protein [Bryobacteraceae bacterium]|nr:O-antigen ligase family protein [Bryobacteraceae bacterium]
MTFSQPALARGAYYVAFGSAVSILFSIAVSQILLGLAIALLLLSGEKLRLPRVWIPLGLFLIGTLISLALADTPAAGMPQVRKIYVFTMLPVVFSTIRDRLAMRRLFLSWGVVGAATAVWGLAQFVEKFRQARALGVNFYDYYTAERITGAMSHWMTFGGEEMFVLLMLGAFVLFGTSRRLRELWPWLACAGLLLLALVLGETRSIWVATLVAGIYLIWFWKRAVVLLVPLLLACVVFLGPASVRERFTSFFQPRKNVDSNEFRIVAWRTGLRMIEKHPWFGVGPEEVRLEFNDYVPPDVPRPLPTGWYGHLHNIYLQYAAERGIPTMLLLMWALIQALADFARGVRKLRPGPSDERFILHGAIAVVIATMVAGFFEVNLGDSEVLTMFLVAIACGYTAVATAAQSIAGPKKSVG